MQGMPTSDESRMGVAYSPPTAPSGHRERRSLQFLAGDGAVAGLPDGVVDLAGERRNRPSSSTPSTTGDHEVGVGRGGHADVVVVLPADLAGVPVGCGVELGVLLERGHDRLRHERRVGQPDAPLPGPRGRGARGPPRGRRCRAASDQFRWRRQLRTQCSIAGKPTPSSDGEMLVARKPGLRRDVTVEGHAMATDGCLIRRRDVYENHYRRSSKRVMSIVTSRLA